MRMRRSRQGRKELLGMTKHDSELGIMLMTNNAIQRNFPSHTVKLEDQDSKIQNAKKLV